MAIQFWLVGASGLINEVRRDMTPECLKSGTWQIYYDHGEVPHYDDRFAKMAVNDRIAIKSMNGKGATDITIHAIGIIKYIVKSERLCIVDWKLSGLNRKVDSKGCFGTIHGPYAKDNWIRRIFSL